ncbi:hypothetical protein D9M73_292020 [compost metagenome]
MFRSQHNLALGQSRLEFLPGVLAGLGVARSIGRADGVLCLVALRLQQEGVSGVAEVERLGLLRVFRRGLVPLEQRRRLGDQVELRLGHSFAAVVRLIAEVTVVAGLHG